MGQIFSNLSQMWPFNLFNRLPEVLKIEHFIPLGGFRQTRPRHSVLEGFYYFGIEMAQIFLYKSFIFSPLLSQITLTMCLLGARRTCASEMAEVMCYNEEMNIPAELRPLFVSTQRESPVLKMCSKIYVKNSFRLKDSYMELLSDHFPMSSIGALPFKDAEACATLINAWAAAGTEGRVQNIIQPSEIDPKTQMQLISVIYFEADWENEFDPAATLQKPFWHNDWSSTFVGMLIKSSEERFGYIQELDSKVLEMGFKKSNIKMMFILPKTIETDFQTLTKKLIGMKISDIVDRCSMVRTVIEIPKFKFECEIDEKSAFQALGIIEAFYNFCADFSGIVEGPKSPKISKATQKIYIEIGEHGTKPGAVSRDHVLQDNPVGIEEFVANHPFLFLIYLEEVPLFLGVVGDEKVLIKNIPRLVE